MTLPSTDTLEHLSTRGARVVIDGVTKQYGHSTAVDSVSLDIPSGQFVTLLGASGSGKTTLLRIIAGFVEATSGSIELDGKELSKVPVWRRNLGMVFQNYALFPHMTVAKNVTFPLARRKVPRAERPGLVAEALAAVELTGFENRMPRELSGGQQQRVALARAIVAKPRLLLMDEPLGALDRRLREALQLQIRELSNGLGLTVINVTHDQEEALTMSDRIALLADGRLVQFGTPRELFTAPANETAARFLGESNIIRSTVTDGLLDLPGSRIVVPRAETLTEQSTVNVFVRPHVIDIALSDEPIDPARSWVDATIHAVVYAGDSAKILAKGSPAEELIVRVDPTVAARVTPGDEVRLSWPADSALVLPGTSA